MLIYFVSNLYISTLVPEIIDPVFAKTSQNARFLLSENERFGLVFAKTRVYKFGHNGCYSVTIFSVLPGKQEPVSVHRLPGVNVDVSL